MSFLERVATWLARWSAKRGKMAYVIKMENGQITRNVYFVRYFVINTRWFCLMIHQFLGSDSDELHDHPWDWISILVRGTYTEYRRKNGTGPYEIRRRTPTKHGIVFRWATDAHRVETDRQYTVNEKDQAPMTIFIGGPRRRKWGFWIPNGPGKVKWQYWKDYMGIKR